MTRRLTKIRSDENGATLMEFGLIAPTFMMLLMGVFDIGLSIYMQSILDGAVQKAARDASLESGPTSLASIDTKVTDTVQAILSTATVTYDRKSYFEYSDVARSEVFDDDNNNGLCDDGERYEDENDNAEWDEDVGEDGIGGPKDIVLYTVNVSYDRIFPLDALIGGKGVTTLSSRTVLKNQPYGQQLAANPAVDRICDD
jgi:Flp pilus assembly protein TadG